MELRLIIFVLGVRALVASSVVAMADQAGKLLGAAELTPLVLESLHFDDDAANEWQQLAA